MTPENRSRLTALVAAATKLAEASRLVKEATADVARSGLLPREEIQKAAVQIDACTLRIVDTLERIPS